MQTATRVTRWIVRLAGLAQIILGVLFWAHRALTFIPLHMIVGLVVVLGLWTLSGIAVAARVRPTLILAAVVWGLVLPIFGFTHMAIMPGSLHWIIQVVHLLLGIGALRMAELLAERIEGPKAG